MDKTERKHKLNFDWMRHYSYPTKTAVSYFSIYSPNGSEMKPKPAYKPKMHVVIYISAKEKQHFSPQMLVHSREELINLRKYFL